MGMSFIGSYSGIDQSTIDQLMEAERIPLKKLENRKVSITEEQNAWKDVNTRLNSLFEKMKALESSSAFNTKNATSSDDNYVTMNAGNSAAEGRYNINVERLATSSNVVGKQVLSPKEIGGKENTKKALNIEGNFKVTNADDKIVEIKVEKTDSLQSIATKINDSLTAEVGEKGKDGYEAPEKIGIRATVVDNRLVLSDEKTGTRTIALENVSDDILSEIGLIPMREVTYPLGENEADFNGVKFTNGHGSIFHLNGIRIERDSNRVTDAVEGIAINLNKSHGAGQTDTVTISSDTEKAAKAVQDFVDQYNSTMKFIEDKTAAGDPKIPGSKGSLAGESSLIRLQSSLRRLVTDTLNVKDSNVKDASGIGISTQDRFGALIFDKGKFLEELGKDKDSVVNFFNPKDGGGLVDRVNDYIDGFISKSDGIIKDKNESFAKSLKDLTSRIESFEDRMEKKEAYYVKTFTALDVAMMKAEDQMGWLIGQIDSMNAGRR